MDSYEIIHYDESKNRMRYNTYHNCESVNEAIERHSDKGFIKSNIRGITKHVKYKYSLTEIKSFLN